jgi:hypothetical protein
MRQPHHRPFLLLWSRNEPDKTKSLVCAPTIKNPRISTPAFNRRRTGEGRTYSSTNREQVECEYCGITIQRRSMKHHLLTQNKHYNRPTKRKRISETLHDPIRTYHISLTNGLLTDCPIPLCPGAYKTRDAMRNHSNIKTGRISSSSTRKASYQGANAA